jgi:hypothetical protein
MAIKHDLWEDVTTKTMDLRLMEDFGGVKLQQRVQITRKWKSGEAVETFSEWIDVPVVQDDGRPAFFNPVVKLARL